jgi:hypothetical protein
MLNKLKNSATRREVLHSANAEVKLLLGRGIQNPHDFQTFYICPDSESPGREDPKPFRLCGCI